MNNLLNDRSPYGERMERLRAQLRQLLDPHTDQESRIVDWLGGWDIPTLEPLAAMMARRASTTAAVVVRYDAGLATLTGEPAEVAVSYEQGAGGDPVMVVTFGPAEPHGDGWLPVVAALRATVAPLGGGPPPSSIDCQPQVDGGDAR